MSKEKHPERRGFASALDAGYAGIVRGPFNCLGASSYDPQLEMLDAKDSIR